MPGVAQVWLTDDELNEVAQGLDTLLDLPPNYSVPDAFWSARDKIRIAREGIACPTPAKGGTTMIKTDGRPTIAWAPLDDDILNQDSPEPVADDEELEGAADLLVAP
ncbi:MAG: hypothetical protein KGL39_29815 [Patescibacteria group bacterium]|nr:hypothetical protein [Patescibacteria group bacterium]